MDLNTVFSDYWELLNNYEDHVKGGYRSDHIPPPPFEFSQNSSTPDNLEGVSREEEALLDKITPGSIADCRDCDLHLARKAAIAGRGSDHPRLMVVLPPPRYEEDDLAVPICGESEEFLNKWIAALGLDKDEIYLTNTVKCRTPGTRPPLPRELFSCRNRLYEQIELLKPAALLILGETALAAFNDILADEIQGSSTLKNYHGRPFRIGETFSLATYTPEDVLKHPDFKRPLWEDLKILRDFLNHV